MIKKLKIKRISLLLLLIIGIGSLLNTSNAYKEMDKKVDPIDMEYYISDEVKDAVEKINNLAGDYQGNGTRFVIDSEAYLPGYKLSFNNDRDSLSEEYYEELLEVLDNTIAEGIKDYVLEIEDKDLSIDDFIVKKFDRVLVCVTSLSDEINKGKNNVEMTFNLVDIKDDDQRELFNRISNGKYILDKYIVGGELDLVDFVNDNRSIDGNYGENIGNEIRYNMYLDETSIEKVNILIERYKISEKTKLEEEDLDVFINLMNSLELSSEEMDKLIEEYKNIFTENVKSTKFDTDKYKIIVNDKKGNQGFRNTRKYVYFSIIKK